MLFWWNTHTTMGGLLKTDTGLCFMWQLEKGTQTTTNDPSEPQNREQGHLHVCPVGLNVKINSVYQTQKQDQKFSQILVSLPPRQLSVSLQHHFQALPPVVKTISWLGSEETPKASDMLVYFLFSEIFYWFACEDVSLWSEIPSFSVESLTADVCWSVLFELV